MCIFVYIYRHTHVHVHVYVHIGIHIHIHMTSPFFCQLRREFLISLEKLLCGLASNNDSPAVMKRVDSLATTMPHAFMHQPGCYI